MIAAGLGIVLAFLIGIGCRWFDLPLPAPPRIVGAMLVVLMTLGFLSADVVLATLACPSFCAVNPIRERSLGRSRRPSTGPFNPVYRWPWP